MARDSSIARLQLEVVDPNGFYMRHATEFIKVAQRFQSAVRVVHEDTPYNGKDILDLLSMGAACGSRLLLEATGDDAEAAVDALAAQLRADSVAVGTRQGCT